ncbi:hypothetical protein OAU13_01140 [bacterium]|nr:hypothetical protein [bacterium]
MNEKLEDLMYRAGLTAQGCWDSMDQYDREAIEKFAELIVEECMNAIYDIDDLGGYHFKAASAIKEHFGVES